MRLSTNRWRHLICRMCRRAPAIEPLISLLGGTTVTIKSDRWIRRKALEEGMIEPFVERQVREGVISYGLSSYGYDMRVADEFKVFTNVFNTLVDPKHFDQRSFVDVRGEYCDIPPNSFALARSVEFFRIPRNVLAICLGKSTYARCFRADTRVALIDGSAPTLEELARRAEQGERFWGYSVDASGHVIIALLDAPRYVGRDALVQVQLDNDESVFCTPDHQFMLHDRRMVAAGDLRPGDVLLPFAQRVLSDDALVYQPLSQRFSLASALAGAWHARNQAAAQLVHAVAREYGERDGAVLAAVAYGPTRPGSAGVTPRAAAQQHTAAHSPAQQAPAAGRTVVHVRALPGDHDVYCLTVPEAGNFALAAGVFVHNCGIILNTTPFEPGWRGYVTLEISNTTPLPARIYANEGIGQVLFYESDEDCEVSYADKHGKYLDQIGVVLPRM